MLAGLGDLLRATLDRAMAPELTVAEELRLLERYLDIERVRFGDRLTVDIDVAPDAGDALVPALVLQPLVENAVRHGVARRTGRAAIRIGVRRQGGELQLEVCDRGEGLVRHGGRPAREGVGLSNTRSRLEQLYGPAAALWLNDAPGGGACVGVTLPFHVQPERVHVAAAGA
jgi:LytS/YehU family sensor histidine kinase